MPYQGEYAQYKPLHRIAESERVKALLGNYHVQSRSPSTAKLPDIYSLNELKSNGWQPDWILGIDGSHAEVPVQNGFPGAEACYITVASVLMNIAKIRELDQQRPVDPKVFRTVEQAESVDCVLPGCNVIYENEISAQSSLRRALFKIMTLEGLGSDTETLLDTYHVLLAHKPQGKTQQCPYDDCPDEASYVPNEGHYSCRCSLGRSWYSTDALRIHERMNPIGSNGTIFSEVLQVLERIWLIHILRVFEANDLLSVLKRLAIVIDGPLAIYGQPAWLSRSISIELARLNQVVRRATGGQDILLLGIEKTGNFVDHFNHIDQNEDGSTGRFRECSVALLTDSYIKQNIIFSDSDRPYGYATYFGRKFFYKTKSEAMIVGSLPFLDESHRDLNTAHPDQFPRLVDALSMLDKLASTRYANAVTPLVSAHAEASIPLHLGGKVLEKLARELIEQKK